MARVAAAPESDGGREVTEGSVLHHEALADAWPRREDDIETRLDLWSMLRPAVQPGARA